MSFLYKTLEFDEIIIQLNNFIATPLGKKKLVNFSHMNQYEEIQRALQATDEALQIVYRLGPCPFEGFHDLEGSLNKSLKSGVLAVEELYHIVTHIEGVQKVIAFKNNLPFTAGEIFNYYVDGFVVLPSLKNEIEKCITPNLDINDRASTTLNRIRNAIRNKESDIRRKLESIIRSKPDYLADSLITTRNNRLVIPVKISHKNTVGGIIHDQSDSGQTAFIEPNAIIELNSEISYLFQEEKAEIQAILRRLSEEVATHADILRDNCFYIGELDFMFSKAKYAKKINAKIPIFLNTPFIALKHARHPLIEENKVVANDFYLGGQSNKMMIITGPNTGGKTVAIKTVGLLVLMAQAGLAIPVDGEATLGLFEQVFANIGAEQSILQSLSTFSAHMSQVIDVIDYVDSSSLVILDELGNGTDPKEGEALAMAILEYLHQIGAYVMSTTHYSNLKTFALDVNYLTNASMTFDEVELKPTYKMLVGVPSNSYALTIAKNLGLSARIINRAQHYKDYYSTRLDQMVEKIEVELKELHKKEIVILEAKLEIESQEKEIEILRESLKLQVASNELHAKEYIDEMVSNALEEIEEIVQNIKNIDSNNLKMHHWIDAKKRLSSMNEISMDLENSDYVFKINDRVLIKSLNKHGVITRVNAQTSQITMGNVSLKIKNSDLELSNLIAPKEKIIAPTRALSSKIKFENVPLELNLIGLRVEEALPIINRYLDSALLKRYQSVRIIHGFGTGALRKAVHNYLDKQKFVISYRLGGAGEGGMGATVVILKE